MKKVWAAHRELFPFEAEELAGKIPQGLQAEVIHLISELMLSVLGKGVPQDESAGGGHE